MQTPQIQPTPQVYSTQDVNLASFLRLHGQPVLRVLSRNGRCVFEFPSVAKFIVEEYEQGGSVKAKDFVASQLTLRQLMARFKKPRV